MQVFVYYAIETRMDGWVCKALNVSVQKFSWKKKECQSVC